MFKKYKFDLVFGVLGIAVCGVVGFGILFALESLTALLSFMGVTFLSPIAVAATILVVAGVALALKKKDNE
jgi:hypothetical protein